VTNKSHINLQLLCYAIENVNTTSGSKNLFLLSLIRIGIMPTKYYVHPSGQFPRRYAELSKQQGVLMETSSTRLSLSQLRKYDGLLIVNPMRSLTREEKRAALEFSAEGCGFGVSLAANGIADFEKRLKDPFLQALYGSEIVHVNFNPYPYRLTDNGEPLEIESFFIDKAHKPYDEITSPLTELKVDKDDIEIRSAWVSDVPFDFPENQKVDIGDQHRTEGELLILQSDNVKPILTREIHPADRMITSSGYLEILLRETIGGRYISGKSFDAITTAFYSDRNRTHVVGVVNERIDAAYASSFGKEIVPTGLFFGSVGLFFADRYAEKNVLLGSKVLKHIASLRKDLIREEVLEETNEVKPQEQSETSPPQTRKRVVPITSLYKHSEQQN
jgi:hypothetical protein